MARGSNFYYAGDSNLGAAIGKRLGTALFGDPEAADKLALQRSQMENYTASAEEARAKAGLYNKQGEGVAIQNTASQGLPALIASMFPTVPAPVVHPSGPVTEGDGPAVDTSQPYYPAGASALPGLRAGLPSVIAALAQMKGATVDIPNVMQTLGAFMGDDEMARRALVAGGNSPTETFAITPERADAIRDDTQAADYNKATGVARINHASDIPVANISAGASRDVARIGADARRDVASLGKTVGFSLVSDVLPGAQMTGGERTPERNKEVGGVENSYHLPGDGVEAFDIKPYSGARNFADAKAAMQRTYGSRLVEAIDETNRPGYGPHWHFSIADAPGGKKATAAKTPAAKPPKQLSAASMKMISGELEQQVAASGWEQTPDAGTLGRVRERAVQLFQQNGNPAASVSQALTEVKRRWDAKQAKGKSPPPAPKAASGGNDVRQQALNAIAKGADPAKVRARYKQMTGQELKG